MKTPYDTAIRVQRREIDAIGAAINTQLTLLNHIERQQQEIRSIAAHEAAIAANDLCMPSFAYTARLRAENARLESACSEQNARLTQLRTHATSAVGACRTVERAADGYREEADRRIANAEQAAIDDNSATAFIEARKALRIAARR